MGNVCLGEGTKVGAEINRDLVSVIMPSYNTMRFIGGAIDSVLEQTYSELELIIVDDASTDCTELLLKDVALKDNRVKVVFNEKNLGVSACRNLAINLSRGRYIAFLDSDDAWCREKITDQIKYMKREKVSICYSSYYRVDETGEIIGVCSIRDRVTYLDILKRGGLSTLTMIYDAEVCGKVYFERIYHEDYVMKLKVIKKVGYASGVSKPLAYYRVRRGSLSSNKLLSAKWRWDVYRKYEMLSLIKSAQLFICYLSYNIWDRIIGK